MSRTWPSLSPFVAMRFWFLVLFFSLIAVPAQGQTLWSRPYEPNQLAIEAIVPDAADEAGSLSGATFVTGTVSLNPNIELAAELPLARSTPVGEGTTTTAVGNPFVGIGFSSTSIPILFQFGTRFPVAPSNDASRLGTAADMGRMAAFHREEFALSGLLNTRLQIGRNTTIRLRSGLEYASRPSLVSSVNDRIQNWRVQYDAQMWREGERFLTGLTFTGRALLTSPGTKQHHVGLSLMANWDRVQPGLLVGTSINDLLNSEFVPFAGLTLSISYARP